MRKLFLYIFSCLLSVLFLFFSFPIVNYAGAEAAGRTVYIGGMPAGFVLSMNGVQVLAINEVSTADGKISPALQAGLKPGDLIISIDGQEISSITKFNDTLAKSQGKSLEMTIKRSGNKQKIYASPKKESITGKYKLGVLIRDSVSGIGTVTYIDKETNEYGSLGHAVLDEDNNLMRLSQEKAYSCSIAGVQKGVRGKAGELRGVFLADRGIGTCLRINHTGIYGTVHNQFEKESLKCVKTASLAEAHPGEAIIYSTINGTNPQPYSISIVKVDENNKDNKNFVIKITDSKLIDITGGIVQGMSGSPILQNGKMIGAVTHVFLNDPTRGYGIGIENMNKENQ